MHTKRGVGLILRIEKAFILALAGVIAQIFVHWAIKLDETRQTLSPNGLKYRFDPFSRKSILRKIKPTPIKSHMG